MAKKLAKWLKILKNSKLNFFTSYWMKLPIGIDNHGPQGLNPKDRWYVDFSVGSTRKFSSLAHPYLLDLCWFETMFVKLNFYFDSAVLLSKRNSLILEKIRLLCLKVIFQIHVKHICIGNGFKLSSIVVLFLIKLDSTTDMLNYFKGCRLCKSIG